MSELKMYFIVNKDIEMSKGKIAGQVSHATLKYLLEESKNYNFYNFLNSKDFLEWYSNGNTQKKIILKASQPFMESLEKEGYVTIRDSGLTEIPANSMTCICLGISNKDVLCNKIKGFNRLQLL